MPRHGSYKPDRRMNGKEIGLHYKNQRARNGNAPKRGPFKVVRLTIPPRVLSHLCKNLESIDEAAKNLHIEITPTRKISFSKSENKGSQPKEKKYVDIRQKKDDSVFFYDIPSTSKEGFIIYSEDEPMRDISQRNPKNVTSVDKINKPLGEVSPSLQYFVKQMKESYNAKPKIETVTSEKPAAERSETVAEYFIRNNFSNMIEPDKKEMLVECNTPSTSKVDNLDSDNPNKKVKICQPPGINVQPSTSKEADFMPFRVEPIMYPSTTHCKGKKYKYSYEDIITGTFDEKLDQCLAKGIPIMVKNRDTHDFSCALHEDYYEMLKKQKYKDMLKFREKLPAYKKALEILDVINNNQVIVIRGETGCGKSTQVPQMILDDAILKMKGANIKILVTQPRRIAASSLAIRVASERGESLGSSIGYAVRLEKVECRSTGSIMFCTTGILLNDLEVNQGLTNYSHVILDEVHERDWQMDITMCILKKILGKRRDLKLILMSATIDSESLSAYYDNCPMLHIEGLTYPVEDIYLEDIVQMTKYSLPFDETPQYRPKKWHKYSTKHQGFQNQQAEIIEKNVEYRSLMAPWLEANRGKLDRNVYKTLQDSRIEDLNIPLIFELVQHICSGSPGAILVFLPGLSDITKLMKMFNENPRFPSKTCEIYPLHSKLPTLDQHRIFKRPPAHIRKIIVATNIAETSITIDDIVYVVDCGKVKYTGLNVEKNIATLQVEWASRANLHQRRGRAGRCQPGICYHMVTSFRARTLPERLLPEIQRSNLLEPVLGLKKLRLGMAVEAFKMLLSPPTEGAVKWAVKHLQQCGALDETETLTPLGWHLARLPLHPAAGKLLILGALFGCLDRAASVAAVWGFKDPFMLIIGKELEIDMAKRSLALGEPSDHIAFSEAIIQWESCGSHKDKRAFAYDNFLSMTTIQMLSDMKKQLADNLKQMGFLRTADLTALWENRNANNFSLFKALVAASLYPNIGTVRWFNLTPSAKHKVPRIKAYTAEDGHVCLHPSSVMSTRPVHKGGPVGPLCSTPGANWLVYWLKQRSTDLFLIDVTLVYTLPLLFFGELNVTEANAPDECLISIANMSVCCKKQATELLFKLRTLLDQVLASKITVTHGYTDQHYAFEEQILNTVIELITAEDERTECISGDEDSDD